MGKKHNYNRTDFQNINNKNNGFGTGLLKLIKSDRNIIF